MIELVTVYSSRINFQANYRQRSYENKQRPLLGGWYDVDMPNDFNAPVSGKPLAAGSLRLVDVDIPNDVRDRQVRTVGTNDPPTQDYTNPALYIVLLFRDTRAI